MKRIVIITLLFSSSLICEAQKLCVAESTVLAKAWTSSSDKNAFSKVSGRVDELVASIDFADHDIQSLRKIFAKTHRQFLHEYVQYSGIEKLAAGQYDCLTATSLFADILSKTGYEHSVIETNYHIFITVKTTEGDVIIETTDRFGGFITDRKKIEERISNYRKNVLASATREHYRYSFSMYDVITPDQLAGLLYFNQAVVAYNAGDLRLCSDKLAASKETRNSERITELATVLYHSVILSDLSDDVKAPILNQWKSVVRVEMASR